MWGAGELPQWLGGKEFACPAGAVGYVGSIPESGRTPRGVNGNPLQYSCLENPVDRGAWQAIVQRVTKSQTGQKQPSTHTYKYILVYNSWKWNLSVKEYTYLKIWQIMSVISKQHFTSLHFYQQCISAIFFLVCMPTKEKITLFNLWQINRLK